MYKGSGFAAPVIFSTALDGARDQIREPAALHPEKVSPPTE